MIGAGFAPGSEFLWPFHYAYYWDLTQRIYREEFDPDYDGALDAGIPFCRSGTPSCDADYDYASRPRAVKQAVAPVQLTGRIGKPLITLHGTLDTLLPTGHGADVYDRLVDSAAAAAGTATTASRTAPRRRPVHRLPRPAPPAAALRPRRVQGDDEVGREGRQASPRRVLRPPRER